MTPAARAPYRTSCRGPSSGAFGRPGRLSPIRPARPGTPDAGPCLLTALISYFDRLRCSYPAHTRFEGVVHPGDAIIYPPGYFHATSVQYKDTRDKRGAETGVGRISIAPTFYLPTIPFWGSLRNVHGPPGEYDPLGYESCAYGNPTGAASEWRDDGVRTTGWFARSHVWEGQFGSERPPAQPHATRTRTEQPSERASDGVSNRLKQRIAELEAELAAERKKRRTAELEAEKRRTAELEAEERRTAELEAEKRRTAKLEAELTAEHKKRPVAAESAMSALQEATHDFHIPLALLPVLVLGAIALCASRLRARRRSLGGHGKHT